MKDVVIVDGVRTPIGRMGGSLSGFRAEELAALAIGGLVEKVGIDPKLVDDVYIGSAVFHAQAINVARWAVLKAGLPQSLPGMGVERQCGSGLQAISLAAQAIMSDHADIVIAGGTESCSTIPFLLSRYSEPRPFSLQPPRFLLPQTGPDKDTDFPMGITAENLAKQYDISRGEQDEFGLRSQQRALKAIADGLLKEEIIPVRVPQKKGDPILFDTDEHPRETTIEKLAALPPAFLKNGTVTAGTSSGQNDGAAAVLVMSADKAQELGLRPLGRYIHTAIVGVDPAIMGIGPAYAIPKLLKRTGLRWQDMALVECNEAFAAQTLAVVKELERQGYGVDTDRLNPNGGAIALGHPNGMTGARLAITLLQELRRRGERYGVATLCTGGGQGIAAVFEAL